jgi:hypothetical protein
VLLGLRNYAPRKGVHALYGLPPKMNKLNILEGPQYECLEHLTLNLVGLTGASISTSGMRGLLAFAVGVGTKFSRNPVRARSGLFAS